MKADTIFFCTHCGCYGAQRLVSLSSQCEMAATASRRYFLTKLLDGRNPRTGESLGAVEAVSVVQPGPLSASSRRRG